MTGVLLSLIVNYLPCDVELPKLLATFVACPQRKMPAFLRLDELYSMVSVKMQYSNLKVSLRDDQEDLKFCYDILTDVSRSFAAVIIQLNEELRDAVCIFYLVLRGLDTIEDDMEVPIPKKKLELPVFHEKLLLNDWHVDGIGKGKERLLLEEFYRVSRVHQTLKPEYQEVISDICHKMAMGMCHFLDHDVVTKKDYDMYCHYVAGLVGHGLTRLFASSGLEDPQLDADLTAANSMGLFLQKTNIIRDYYEDICEVPPRIFWPEEIWKVYADDLHKFKDPQYLMQAKECLHAMIADALQHIPDCIEYLARLKEPSVFLFCAIPQVMAIATLARLYNNEKVFCDKVKIRKGLACKIILHSTSLESALRMFRGHCDELEHMLLEDDPSFDTCRQYLAIGKQNIDARLKSNESYARRFLTRYPALGGQLLYSIVDGIGGYFSSEDTARKTA